MNPRSLLLILLVSSFAATVAHGQQSPVPLRPDDVDQRYPGFFVGAGLGLLLSAVTFAWCADGDNSCNSAAVLPLGVLMAGVIGLSGAVIGGFLPK
jgi:hypothetical protein